MGTTTKTTSIKYSGGDTASDNEGNKTTSDWGSRLARFLLFREELLTYWMGLTFTNNQHEKARAPTTHQGVEKKRAASTRSVCGPAGRRKLRDIQPAHVDARAHHYFSRLDSDSELPSGDRFFALLLSRPLRSSFKGVHLQRLGAAIKIATTKPVNLWESTGYHEMVMITETIVAQATCE